MRWSEEWPRQDLNLRHRGLAVKKVDDVEYQFALASSFGWTLAELVVLRRYRVTAR
jgi:hypothetical protein